MREIYRILDANFNRAREGLRVAEDCGRFALNDPAVTQIAKNLRSDLKQVISSLPYDEMLTSRDTPGDIGTELTSPSEPVRKDLRDVVIAACKRLTEALRTIEEYCKIVAPSQVVQIERMRYDSYTLEQRLIGKMLISESLRRPQLHVLVTSALCKGSVRETVRKAIAGGADVIQLREKNLPDAQFLAFAAEIRELTDDTGRMFIVNDRADIAAIVGADGVHLGQYDLPIAETRRVLRPGAIIGRSTHNMKQVHVAVTEGADYIGVGPMFETTTKDAGPVAGPDFARQVAEENAVPAVAIGGINADNIDQLTAVGVRSVAVCGAVIAADDPKQAAMKIKAALSTE
ncbi:MAG: thiamine phosphate synthase [Phycisphaerae bacterium]